MSMPIFLASGNRMKRVMWDTKWTLEELASLHKKGERQKAGWVDARPGWENKIPPTPSLLPSDARSAIAGDALAQLDA